MGVVEGVGWGEGGAFNAGKYWCYWKPLHDVESTMDQYLQRIVSRRFRVA